MTREQAARVAFEADRALCAHLTMRSLAARRWDRLSTDARALWIDEGPTMPGEPSDKRRALYKTIMGHLLGDG